MMKKKRMAAVIKHQCTVKRPTKASRDENVQKKALNREKKQQYETLTNTLRKQYLKVETRRDKNAKAR